VVIFRRWDGPPPHRDGLTRVSYSLHYNLHRERKEEEKSNQLSLATIKNDAECEASYLISPPGLGPDKRPDVVSI
jgi:hypothetical protein